MYLRSVFTGCNKIVNAVVVAHQMLEEWLGGDVFGKVLIEPVTSVQPVHLSRTTSVSHAGHTTCRQPIFYAIYDRHVHAYKIEIKRY